MVSRLNTLIFDPEPLANDLFSRVSSIAVLASLFLLGVLHWLFFFQFGRMEFSGGDWHDGLFYFSVIRESISDLTIPYFVEPIARNWSDTRFLANPQSVISPQMLLAPFMNAGNFVLANTLIMYSIGFAGCLLIRNRYHLSLLPFVFLFLLFNFNGHITSHLSVGHSMWYGYFLLPLFFYFLLELLPPSPKLRLGASIILAFVLFAIVLQGSFHIFVWCLIFLAILGFFNRHSRKDVALAILFAVGLSLFRLVPTIFVRLDYQHVYASGFPTFSTFVDALTTIKSFTFEHPSSPIYNVGWWEHDHFIGYTGVAFVVFFGIYHRFSSSSVLAKLKFQALDIPILLLVLFSFGFVFDLISDLRLPLLSYTERVPSRFFIISLIGLVIIGAIRMQALLPTYNRNFAFKVLSVGAIIQLTHSLVAHSDFWRVERSQLDSAEFMDNLILSGPAYSDSWYTNTVNASAVFSAVTILVLAVLGLWLFLHSRR